MRACDICTTDTGVAEYTVYRTTGVAAVIATLDLCEGCGNAVERDGVVIAVAQRTKPGRLRELRGRA